MPLNTRPELYLTFELSRSNLGQAATALEAALDAASAASLLIRPVLGQPALDAGLAKSLVTLAQKRGVATLIADDANLARMLKADGLHLSWSKDTAQRYREARVVLGERYSIGADAGRSRDVAMVLGEAGADYIAFGIPPHVEDRATAEARQRDLVSWWSEIFQVPCVALDIASPEQAQRLAENGADFIEVTITDAMTGDEIADRLSAFTAAVAAEGEPA
jgi:thiamine-phosphate pyrophosphorylase